MRNVQRKSMGATRSKQKENVADPLQKPYKGTVGVSDYGVILFTIGLHTMSPTTAARYKGTRDAVNTEDDSRSLQAGAAAIPTSSK